MSSNLSCGPATIKYMVYIFNLIFFLSGLIVVTIGGLAQGFFSDKMIFFENKYETPAIGLVIVGSVIMIVSFFGCCGAQKENICMLKTFSGLMFLLLICEVLSVVTVLALRGEMEEIVNNNMKKSLQQYGQEDNELLNQAWDNLQEEYKCCGVHSPNDWVNSTFSKGTNAPDSCCVEYKAGCGKGALPFMKDNVLFEEGCFNSLQDSARRNLGAIIGGAVGIILVQMIGVWMSCTLIKSVRERYEIL